MTNCHVMYGVLPKRRSIFVGLLQNNPLGRETP